MEGKILLTRNTYQNKVQYNYCFQLSSSRSALEEIST
jgi:hypothetical protein